MYQTYKSEESCGKKEEKLIPKEVICVDEKEYENPSKKTRGGLFGSLESDELLILGLLILLYFEDCKDNMLMVILAALLIMK